MLKTKDIKEQLLHKYDYGFFRETGYNCVNGKRYVDLRHVIFIVDKPYIFEESLDFEPRMDKEWYDKNYWPRIDNQINGLVDTLINNPCSRQATLVLARQDEYDTNDHICTMYSHVFLDTIVDNTYAIEYSVNLRSSDAFDFVSDVKWNTLVVDTILDKLVEKTGWQILKLPIIWHADSFQLSIEKYNKIKEKYNKIKNENNTTFN